MAFRAALAEPGAFSASAGRGSGGGSGEGQDSWASISKAHLETFGQLLFTSLYRRILVFSQLVGTSWYHPWSNREQDPDSPPLLRVPLAHLSPL